MAVAENKALARRLFEAWNAGDAAELDQLLAPDCVLHLGSRPDVRGIDAYRTFYAAYRAALPDLRWTVEDEVGEGDKVAARWTLRGTHRGELLGIPPTGKAVTVTGISIARIADGRLAESWTQSDILGLLQQLGAVPTPCQAAS